MIVYVWAQDANGLIGQDGHLPWQLPNDLKFFKEVTMGQTIVMGRSTFDGMGKRLLPGRHTIVVTHNQAYDGAGAEVLHDVHTLVEDGQYEDLYVIGGAVLFEALKDSVEVLYCTKIDATFEGDVYFPEDFPWEEFELVKETDGIVDEKNLYAHKFQIYQRKGAVSDDDMA